MKRTAEQSQTPEQAPLSTLESDTPALIESNRIQEEQEAFVDQQTLLRHCRHIRRCGRLSRIVWRIHLLFWALCLIPLPRLIMRHDEIASDAMGLWSGFVLLSLLVWLLPVLLISNGYSKRALASLKQAQDVRSIGPLIEGLSSREYRQDVVLVLTPLLSLLRASDAHLLNDRHHESLAQALTQRSDKHVYETERKFAVAVLKAWEQVGTSKVAPVVEHLAKTAKNEEVRQAAQACLPFLQARVEQERNEQTLLRATTPPECVAGELLRPAAERSETAPLQLLRPHTFSDDS